MGVGIERYLPPFLSFPFLSFLTSFSYIPSSSGTHARNGHLWLLLLLPTGGWGLYAF